MLCNAILNCDLDVHKMNANNNYYPKAIKSMNDIKSIKIPSPLQTRDLQREERGFIVEHIKYSLTKTESICDHLTLLVNPLMQKPFLHKYMSHIIPETGKPTQRRRSMNITKRL